MRTNVLLVAALLGGAILVIVGFAAALGKPGEREAERIERSDEAMKRVRDDPTEPARWVP